MLTSKAVLKILHQSVSSNSTTTLNAPVKMAWNYCIICIILLACEMDEDYASSDSHEVCINKPANESE